MKKRKLSDFLSKTDLQDGKVSGGFFNIKGGTVLIVPVPNSQCTNDWYCQNSNIGCTNSWNCEQTGNSKGCSNGHACFA